MLSSLKSEFEDLDARWTSSLERIPEEELFAVAIDGRSFGECLLKSAGAVEQVFGGINSSLWDDPFEWTLPESMNGKSDLARYLDEVSSARDSGFARIINDDDLNKEISTPWGMKTLGSALDDALRKANEFHNLCETIISNGLQE